MKYRQLGKTALEISRIGFGCISLGEDYHASERLLHQAVDYGINYFDTADLYQKGMNEETVGKALKQRPEAIIATKVGNQWRPDGSGWDWNPRKNYILESVEGSLRRLQRDHIDLYQLHGGTIEDNIEETIEAFEILQKQGKIRYYGISSIRPNVIRAYIGKSKIVSNMTQYSLLDRRPEEDTLDLLYKQEVGVVSRGSVAKGLLAGKSASEYLGYSNKEVARMATIVKDIARDHLSSASVALNYVLNHQAVTAAIVGMSNERQLNEAIQAVDDQPLNREEIDRLKSALEPKKYEMHR